MGAARFAVAFAAVGVARLRSQLVGAYHGWHRL